LPVFASRLIPLLGVGEMLQVVFLLPVENVMVSPGQIVADGGFTESAAWRRLEAIKKRSTLRADRVFKLASN
jgi:hypothetical protein